MSPFVAAPMWIGLVAFAITAAPAPGYAANSTSSSPPSPASSRPFAPAPHATTAAGSGDGKIAATAGQGSPEVATGENSRIGHTIVLSGQITSIGEATVTECLFEYIDDESFRASGYAGANSATCNPAPPFFSPTDVSATISSYQEGVLYHYRLYAANAKGAGTGTDYEFTTPIFPNVTTGPVAKLAPRSVSLTGDVDPAGGGPITECLFEIIDDSAFRANGYADSKIAPCLPTPPYSIQTEVTATIAGLQPETAYHYRTVAANDAGATAGKDNTFTTSPSAAENENEYEPPGEVHHGPVKCSKQPCSRVLSASTSLQKWVSPRFPISFGWRFNILRRGHMLKGTVDETGCGGTFTGRGMIATLNGCHGQLKLIYIGTGHFTVRWKVIAPQ